MTNELTRINQLEQEAMFSEELIAKLQIDAAQVTAKDKLIAEMQKALDEANAHAARLRIAASRMRTFKVGTRNYEIGQAMLDETPAQSLREVRADAVEGFYKQLEIECTHELDSGEARAAYTEYYAKQLRNGEPK